jgi:hypothetical protein
MNLMPDIDKPDSLSLFFNAIPKIPLIGIAVSILSISWHIVNNWGVVPLFLVNSLIIFILFVIIILTMFFYRSHRGLKHAISSYTSKLDSKVIHFIFKANLNNTITLQRCLREIDTATQNYNIAIASIEKTNRYEIRANYYNSIVKITRELFGNVLNQTKRTVEYYLKNNDIDLTVALSIKQLNKPYNYGSNNFADLKVFTIFRDFDTYTDHVREVAKKAYTITGNTDFQHLLCEEEFRSAIYLNNHLEDKFRGPYRNENATHLDHYDAVICTSIADYSVGNKLVYGFLTCDTKKTDKYKDKEVFDLELGNLLLSASAILAIYYRNTENYWSELLSESFLETACTEELRRN